MNIKNIIGYSLLGAGAYVQKAYADSPTFAPSVGPLALTGVASYSCEDYPNSFCVLLEGSFPESDDTAYYTNICPPTGSTPITAASDSSDINDDQDKIKTEFFYNVSTINNYCWVACKGSLVQYSTSDCTSAYAYTPTMAPTAAPTTPTHGPTFSPTFEPTLNPTFQPTLSYHPSFAPSVGPLALTGVASYSCEDYPNSFCVLLEGSFPESDDTAYYTNICPPTGSTPITAASDSSDINDDQDKIKTEFFYNVSTINNYCWVACKGSLVQYSTSDCTSAYAYTPTTVPTEAPTTPTHGPTFLPTFQPTFNPTFQPTFNPTFEPTFNPTFQPTFNPTFEPTFNPTFQPTFNPTFLPTYNPTFLPTFLPTYHPTFSPTTTPPEVTGVSSYNCESYPNSLCVSLDGSFPNNDDIAYYTAGINCPPSDGITVITEVTSTINSGETKIKTDFFYNISTSNDYCWMACRGTGLEKYTAQDGTCSEGSTAYALTPTMIPTAAPTTPTHGPTFSPTFQPTLDPTFQPTLSYHPTFAPSVGPLALTGVASYSCEDYPNSFCVLLEGSFPESDDTAYYTNICPPTGSTPITAASDSSDINDDQDKIKTEFFYNVSTINNYCWVACKGSLVQYSTSDCTSAYAYTPTMAPTEAPTTPTQGPTFLPTFQPTFNPTFQPTFNPTFLPTFNPTFQPTFNPTFSPTQVPTVVPSFDPTVVPSTVPTFAPSSGPTTSPTNGPTEPGATNVPTRTPTLRPSVPPSTVPTQTPTISPTTSGPTLAPTKQPTIVPTVVPTQTPTLVPTKQPTVVPTVVPTVSPSLIPTQKPTVTPTTTIPTVIPTRRPSFTTTALPTGGDGAFPTVLPTNSSSFRGASKTNSETESAENGVVTAAIIIGPVMIFVLAALVVHQQCFQRREPALPGSKERNLMESVHGQGVELVNDNELESANDHGGEPVNEHEIENGRGAQLKMFGFWGGASKKEGYGTLVQSAESPMQYRAPSPKAGTGE